MSLSNRIDTASNITTIVVAALLGAVLIKVYFVPVSAPQGLPGAAGLSQRPAVQAQALVGTSLKGRVPGVDWSKNGRTLVLAISIQCHFCTESAPFYRKLQAQVGKVVKMVAVLPQPVEAAEQYLKGEGVRVDLVKQLQLGDVGVRGTPTMLLVNNAGVVTRVWNGKLRPEDEERVLSTLRDSRS